MAESPPNPPMACYPLPSTVPPVPLSILHCLAPDGSLYLQKYHDYSALLSAKARWRMSTTMDLVNGEYGGESLLLSKANIAALMKKTLAKKCVFGRTGAEDAPIKVIQPEQSSWYQMYVVNFCLMEEDSSEAMKFRTRFCLPYSSFLDLVADISANDIFD
jgi:hypothetical protein